MVKNKKAWLKIAEASIGIIIIATILLISYNQTIMEKSISEEVYIIQQNILEEIASNTELRTEVLTKPTIPEKEADSNYKINAFVKSKLTENFNFSIMICDLEKPCNFPHILEKDIFAEDRIISATLTEYNPKKVRLFIWKK